MSCILLCETRAKVCCKAGSIRPLLGGAAGSNLHACRNQNTPRLVNCIWDCYVNSDDLQHPTGVLLSMEEILHHPGYLQGFIHPRWCRISSINSSVRFEIWDQGNKLKCPLPGTHNIHAHFTKIILRNFSISNR